MYDMEELAESGEDWADVLRLMMLIAGLIAAIAIGFELYLRYIGKGIEEEHG
jgi:hypothetical protein